MTLPCPAGCLSLLGLQNFKDEIFGLGKYAKKAAPKAPKTAEPGIPDATPVLSSASVDDEQV